MSSLLKRYKLIRSVNNLICQGKTYSSKGTKFDSSDSPYLNLLIGAGAISLIIGGFTFTKAILERKGSETTEPLAVKISDNSPQLNLRQKFNFINKVVEKCAPAVVYVEIKDPKKIDRGTDNAVIVSNGSGFIVREDGWILTNAHVVINKPNATIEVKLHDGSTHRATVRDADMNIDLALIKINPDRKLSTLGIARSGDVAVGEWVVALGSPLSLSHSATAGVISSVDRKADELGLRNVKMKYIQTDAPITFGNSGGPLVNLDGRVIGINNLRITSGISFAIPVEYITKFLDKIVNTPHSKTAPPQLGLTTLTVSGDVLKSLIGDDTHDDTINQAVLVWKLQPGGVADKGGLMLGDVITHVDGKQVIQSAHVFKNIAERGKIYDVGVIRNGKRETLKLKAEKM